MRSVLVVLMILLTASTGCTAPRHGFDAAEVVDAAQVTRMARLAEVHEEGSLAKVNEYGLFTTYAIQPWDDTRRGIRNYRRSHNVPDMPCWHGYLMAGLAFEAAVLNREGADTAHLDAELLRLADGLRTMSRVTGEPGLLANSLVPGYTGEEPLDFMTDPKTDPNKPWVRSTTTGEWFRDGINKGHLNLAAFGCAVPLALERRGEIALRDGTRDALIEPLVALARRLIDNDFQITNRNGERTQHPNLGPNSGPVANPFNRTVMLHILVSAAPYDDEVAAEYERRVESWSGSIPKMMSISGWWAKQRGHWNRKANVGHSDPQQFSLAATSLLLQEDRERYRRAFVGGLDGWWSFMKYEFNAAYTLPYAHFVAKDPAKRDALVAPIVGELCAFPEVKVYGGIEWERTPGVVQSIRDRPVDENYWKADPYRRVISRDPDHPGHVHAGASDYVLAYWMGCYFGLIERPQ